MSHSSRFQDTVADWQTRLLQLDKRNNLLNFKPKRAVRILNRAADAFARELSSSRNGLRFDYIELKRRVTAPPEEPDIRGDIDVDIPLGELQRRLGRLRKRDKEFEEEQGLNVLFVSIGVLHWMDEDGERMLSPLLLFPCDLLRPNPREPFRLQREDEDAMENATLRHKLGLAGVELPESAGGEPADYLQAVQSAVAERSEWTVSDEIYLATFAYSKLAMWQDLDEVRANGTDHRLVGELAGEKSERAPGEPTPSPFPPDSELAGGGLDDVAPLNDLRRQFTVLEADASQLRAIEAARSGANLVIHGPPGTGKSQTIANIIATLLGEGRHVLFVSEKTAALDVVKRRLEDSDLGTFLLDLHSERGRKASVYEQLRRSVVSQPQQTIGSPSFDELLKRRQTLNQYVRLLHRVRQPLGCSVYQMNAHYAAVQDAPIADFDVLEPLSIDRELLSASAEAAGQMAARASQFDEHSTSPWLPLLEEQPSVQLADRIQKDMAGVRRSVDDLRTAVVPVSEWVGVLEPQTVEDTTRLAQLCKHLAACPGVSSNWLKGDVVNRLRRIGDRQRHIRSAYTERVEAITAHFASGVPDVPYAHLAQQLRVSPAEETAISRFWGEGWRVDVVADTAGMLRAAAQLDDSNSKLKDALVPCLDAVGVPAPGTWAELDGLCELASTVVQVGAIPTMWADQSRVDAVRRAIGEAQQVVACLKSAEAGMREWFSDGVLEEADASMLRRFRVDYQSVLKRLFGAYRQDRQLLRGFMVAPRSLSRLEAVVALESVEAVRAAHREWDTSVSQWESILGTRFDGQTTDWDACGDALSKVGALRARWPAASDSFADVLTSSDRVFRVGQTMKTLVGAREALRSAVPEAVADSILGPETSLSEPETVLKAAAEPLAALARAVGPLRAAWTLAPRDLSQLRQVIDSGQQVREIENDERRVEEELRTDFDVRYSGLETDWDEVLAALQWTEKFLILAGRQLSPRLAGHAQGPVEANEYQERMSLSSHAIAEYKEALDSATSRFDESKTRWRSWGAAPFEELTGWASRLSEDAGAANDWLEYRSAVDALDGVVGAPVGDELHRVANKAAQVPAIVRRRLIGAWLDAVAVDEPQLSSFSARNHDEVRRRFRDLDQAFPEAARKRVRSHCFGDYPERSALGIRRGQLATLRGELSKKRRHLPVRKLFERIPQLLLSLKPCVMVSPLAVSQYLPRGRVASESLAFDTVIFDEASQVFPEDAVPALLRAKQAIVVGDEKQLPPTNFFRSALLEDEDGDPDDDEDSSAFLGRESILDVLVGQVGADVGQSTLDVHYRSKHDSLIRFSNHHFYDDRLLVFPQPEHAPTGFGIQSLYLPDARYDAGASRTNPVEAERIVEEVVKLFERQPHDSVGVVALSRAQRDRIEALVQIRRFDRPDLEDAFNESRDEPFFVKNLENVQGDERDHILLSIGYGPTVGSDAVPNRFGPLNREGGERRLNVAVTRARRSMTVVHSLRPVDIVSITPGAQLLRRYLEFVRDPVRAFEKEVTVDPGAEPESPFEEAVLRVLERRGHRVDPQVGVSGYRIDLGIRSVDGSRYDLGIECDGYTYHSTPTARDRDWLRQQVLEGLGWCIHRIWSTAWVRDPEAEIRRLEEALASSRSRQGAAQVPPGALRQRPNIEARRIDSDLELDSESEAELFRPYQQASLDDIKIGPGLQEEAYIKLFLLVQRVVETEGPVHFDVVVDRVRVRYGLGRAGRLIRERVQKAVRRMVRETALSRLGKGGEMQFLCIGGAAVEPRRVDGASGRRIDQVALAELRVGIVRILQASYGSSLEELIEEAARQFGYRRTGGQIVDRLRKALDELLGAGVAVESFGQVTLAEPETDGAQT